jgi:hypothetical protein
VEKDKTEPNTVRLSQERILSGRWLGFIVGEPAVLQYLNLPENLP